MSALHQPAGAVIHEPSGSTRASGRDVLFMAIAVLVTLPWLALRFQGYHGDPAVVAAMSGLAIVGAAFLLSWAAEAFEKDVSQALALALQGDHSAATSLLVDGLRFARHRHAGLENEARMLCDLAWIQTRAGLSDRARLTAEEAAIVSSRRGAKVWQAYAEWLLHGASTPLFKKMIDETGAHLLTTLVSRA